MAAETLLANALDDVVLDGPVPSAAAVDAARDARLVAAARRSPDDFRALVVLHEQRVYATALRILGDEAEARDVAQDAFLKAYRSLASFRAGKRFGPWVCAIAANAARDRLRSPLRRWFTSTEGAALDQHEAPPPTAVDDREARAARAILALAPKLREAIVLRYVSGLSVDEVAEALGIGESAAKMRLKRAVDELRAALHDG